jgi:hypothetical protein
MNAIMMPLTRKHHTVIAQRLFDAGSGLVAWAGRPLNPAPGSCLRRRISWAAQKNRASLALDSPPVCPSLVLKQANAEGSFACGRAGARRAHAGAAGLQALG